MRTILAWVLLCAVAVAQCATGDETEIARKQAEAAKAEYEQQPTPEQALQAPVKVTFRDPNSKLTLSLARMITATYYNSCLEVGRFLFPSSNADRIATLPKPEIELELGVAESEERFSSINLWVGSTSLSLAHFDEEKFAQVVVTACLQAVMTTQQKKDVAHSGAINSRAQVDVRELLLEQKRK